jgi:hypothetical protein
MPPIDIFSSVKKPAALVAGGFLPPAQDGSRHMASYGVI